MNCKTVQTILSDTAYVRTAGSGEEVRCSAYLASLCEKIGLKPQTEAFPVPAYETELATLTVDNSPISCKGIWGAGSGSIAAPLAYLPGTDAPTKRICKGKIVLLDRGVGKELHQELVSCGAAGFITYNGNLNYTDQDVDQREMRFRTEKPLLPAVNINAKDAFSLLKKQGKTAEIHLKQKESTALSHNVIVDIEGETDETLLICAHYDSTSLSKGAFDNMSGCIGLLYLAEYFASRPHKRKIRLLFCGSEERGLLGSRHYCRMHKDELKKTVLNINLDMMGCAMGSFAAINCINEEMTDLLTSFLKKRRFAADLRYDIRSSDSNSFLACGVPAVSFARYSPAGMIPIHTRYDTAETVSPKRLLGDMKIVAAFAELFANAHPLPISLAISEKIQTSVEDYMKRQAPLINEI